MGEVLELSDKEKTIIIILSIIGFYTIVEKFADIDTEYFNGNLIISFIIIPLFLLFLLAGILFLFNPNKKRERFVGLYYLGIATAIGWLYYVSVFD